MLQRTVAGATVRSTWTLSITWHLACLDRARLRLPHGRRFLQFGMPEIAATAKPRKPTRSRKPASDRLIEFEIRPTPVRLAVYDALLRASRALSHAELQEALGEQDIDRVTLYRTLDRFAEAGLVEKTVGPDRIAAFAARDDADHSDHAHFHCSGCRRVYCLSQQLPRMRHLPAGFTPATTELSVHGRCPSCSRA